MDINIRKWAGDVIKPITGSMKWNQRSRLARTVAGVAAAGISSVH